MSSYDYINAIGKDNNPFINNVNRVQGPVKGAPQTGFEGTKGTARADVDYVGNNVAPGWAASYNRDGLTPNVGPRETSNGIVGGRLNVTLNDLAR